MLPSAVKPYKLTPLFNENTLPAGPLKSRSKKEGASAKVIVIEGGLTLRILEPAVEEVILTPALSGVVEPTVKHEVVPSQRVRFYVEFYR